MQRKKWKILAGAVCFLTFFQSVNAACDYDRQVELMTQASNVNITYEIGEFATGNQIESDDDPNVEMVDEYETRFKIDIYNLTPDIYVEVKNNYTNETETYYYDDSDEGTITWYRLPEDFDHLVGYTVTVYSNDTNCRGDVLQILPELITPQFNYLANEAECRSLKNQGQTPYYCEPYITTDLNMDYYEFLEIANSELDKLEQAEADQTEDDNFWERYGYIFLIVIIVILIGGIATVIVRRYKRSSIK